MCVWHFLSKYFACTFGTTAIEYALIAVGIAMTIMAALFFFGDTFESMLDLISDSFSDAFG